MVLAGGVHHCHDLTLWSVFSQLRALSPSGRIRPFDREADGILIGEGTGIVVLKRLADAERDGDRVYAVIRGTGVASDGRDTSLMSPGVEGQVPAVEQAWTASGLDPATRRPDRGPRHRHPGRRRGRAGDAAPGLRQGGRRSGHGRCSAR